MMTALIIEDEISASRHLMKMIAKAGDITVLSVLETVAETVQWLSENPLPDIIFMDIHLADGSAFEIFRRVNVACPVIFTTAYDEYALKAFKVNSIDYLLKPVEAEDVQNAIKKLQNLSSRGNIQDVVTRMIDTFQKSINYKTHFLIPSKGDKLIPLKTEDISCFYIDSGVVKAITMEGKCHCMEFTLDELSDQLDPSEFFRANRQYIISRKAVRDIDLWFNSRLSVNLKISVPEKIIVSKARITEFKKWFEAK